MSTKLDGLSRRLAKVEKAVAENAERERLANCNCKLIAKLSPPTIVYSSQPEEFEIEMNQTCPVHGFRRLEHIIVFKVVDQDGRYDTRINELMAEYNARLAAWKSTSKKVDHE